MTPEEKLNKLYDWNFWARDEQLIPASRSPDDPRGDWIYWLYMAGRGAGKTRTGAEAVREWIKAGFNYVNLIGATAEDVRAIMIEGDSGIMKVCPNGVRPRYLANQKTLKWPTGQASMIFSAEEPDRLRGKQHEKLWADEVASWRYPETWDQALFGLRLGIKPQAVITTTPRPNHLIRTLIADQKTHLTRGTTFDNIDNLAGDFAERIIAQYKGTRLGRQELYAQLLEDNPGALWRAADIDEARINPAVDARFRTFHGALTPDVILKALPPLRRVVVAIDPAVSSKENSDETGIIVAGMDEDGQLYVLDDRSGVMKPEEWAKAAVGAYREWQADRIIGEVNQGGDMVEATIRTCDPAVPYRAVHATRGKLTRAEAPSLLYEQHRVHHVGIFPRLEDQMLNFTPGDRPSRAKTRKERMPDGIAHASRSPDRVDGLVWALTELAIKPRSTGFLDYVAGLVKQAKAEAAGQHG